MKHEKIILTRIDGLLLKAHSFNEELTSLQHEVKNHFAEAKANPTVVSEPAPPVTPAPAQTHAPVPTPTPAPTVAPTPTPQAPLHRPGPPPPPPMATQAPVTGPPRPPVPAPQRPVLSAPTQGTTPHTTGYTAGPPPPRTPRGGHKTGGFINPRLEGNKPPKPPGPPKTPPTAPRSFFERFPHMEKLLGEKLIPFIGILVLVTGIGFFVSYAIDQEWINEAGRAGIGVLCGGLLMGIAHRMRKNYRVFSSILLGGGVATLYFTVAYAYHQYELISQTSAFFIMIGITALTALASIYYDRREVAILGMLGGFLTPIMVSNGGGDYMVLFTYLTILNLGNMFLAFRKNWKELNFIGFGLTTLIFSGRIITLYGADNYSPLGFLGFATGFFVIFFVMNIAWNTRKGKKFEGLDYIFLLLNAGLFYGAGMYILGDFHDGAFRGLFTGVVGIFHFIFALVLYRRKTLDRNLIYTLIGMVLTFLTLAAPVQLEGNHITLFWAAEAILLLWLSQRTKLAVLRSGSVIVSGAMLVSLIMDWHQHFTPVLFGQAEAPIVPILINPLFITTMVALASMIAYNFLLRKEPNEGHIDFFGLPLMSIGIYRKMFPMVTALFVYLGLFLELDYQLLSREFEGGFRMVIIHSFNGAFVLILYGFVARFKNPLLKGMAMLGNVLVILTYGIFVHHQTSGFRMESILHDASTIPFAYHFINLGMVIALILRLYKHVQNDEWLAKSRNAFIWIFSAMALFLLCTELDHLMTFVLNDGTYGSVEHALRASHKAGYPVVFGGTAFLLIVWGLRRKHLHLRLVGLSILGFTLLKIFAVDVWEMGQLGRIIAFISLGILILVIAFLYQRIKRLLFEQEQSDAAEAENNPETPQL